MWKLYFRFGDDEPWMVLRGASRGPMGWQTCKVAAQARISWGLQELEGIQYRLERVEPMEVL